MTAAASARCRTRPSRSVPASRASPRRSGTGRSRSRCRDLVLLDRERCIQCARCTRFADEIAGDPLITFGERGGHTEIETFPDEPFSSYFSGNTVQICPVGALDVEAVPLPGATVGPLGGRDELHRVRGPVPRRAGVELQPVGAPARGRQRAGEPRLAVRQGPVRLRGRAPRVADRAPDGAPRRRARRVLVAGGARRRGRCVARGARRRRCRADRGLGRRAGTNEDAYVWARFAKGVLRTDNVDAQLGDGLPADVALGLPHATIADLDRARGIVVLGVDPKEELPVLYLRGPPRRGRARRAAHRGHADGDRAHALRVGQRPVRARRAGRGRRRTGRRDPRRHRCDRRRSRPRPPPWRVATATSSSSPGGATWPNRPTPRWPRSRRWPGSTRRASSSALHRGNVRGALDLGLAPGFLPGRVALDAGRDWFEDAWGAVPGEPGSTASASCAPRPTAGSARSCSSVPIRTATVPTAPSRPPGVTGARFVIAVDMFLTESTRRADVFLPVTTWGEQDGTVTNLEGTRAARRPQGLARRHGHAGLADRRRARAAAPRGLRPRDRGGDPGRDRTGRAGVRRRHEHPRAARRDGVVLPIAEHPDEIVLRRLSIPLTDASWEPIVPVPSTTATPPRRPRRHRTGRGPTPRRPPTATTTADEPSRRGRGPVDAHRPCTPGPAPRSPRAVRGATPTLCAS